MTTLLADQKGRITLGKEYAGQTLLAEKQPNGVVTLRPALTVPTSEAWLWKNKRALGLVQAGIEGASRGEKSKAPNMSKAAKLAAKIKD